MTPIQQILDKSEREFEEKIYKGEYRGERQNSSVAGDLGAGFIIAGDARDIFHKFALELLKGVIEEIKNSPKTFGLLDKQNRGGAILVDDIISLLESNIKER